MGDRTDYQITIGGKMTPDTLSQLVETIEAEGLGLEWEGGATADELRGAFVDAALNGQAVTLNAHDVNYGNADDVESFCCAHDLPYRKEWDAGGGYGPGVEVFDGEACREYTSAGIGNGGPMLDHPTFNGLATREAVAEWFAAAAFEPPAVVIAA